MRTVKALLLSTSLATAAWANDPSSLSAGSQLSAEGSTAIYSGTLTAVTGSAEFTVESLQVVGDALHVALKGSAKAGEVVLELPLKAAGAGSYVVGQGITIVAEGLGWLVTRGGEVIGFIPKEAGRALLHSKRVEAAMR